MPESTINIFLGALMGIVGGLISTPLNAIFAWFLKQEEISYQSRLEHVYRKRELYWKHHLESTSAGRVVDEISFINTKIKLLENKLQYIESNHLSDLESKMHKVNEMLRQVGITIKNINQQVYEIEQKIGNKG